MIGEDFSRAGVRTIQNRPDSDYMIFAFHAGHSRAQAFFSTLLLCGLLALVSRPALANGTPATSPIVSAVESVDSLGHFALTLDINIERLLSYRQLVAETAEETESETELAGYHDHGGSHDDDATVSLEELSFDLSDRSAWLVGSRLVESATARIERGLAIRALPISTPVEGTITSGFGLRNHPILRGRRMHKGLDIAAPTGTEIAAPGAGVVTFSGRKGGYGNTVIVDHGYGYTTLYAHCSKLLVEEGARVSRNDVIALVGSTGRSTGPHLHYEVRVDGAHMNPRVFTLYDRDDEAFLAAITEWYLTV